jgi:hypothetical protein
LRVVYGKQSEIFAHPLGEHWEVESDAATLGEAENRSEAIELAMETGFSLRSYSQPRFAWLRRAASLGHE